VARLERSLEDLRQLAVRQEAALSPLLAAAGAPVVAEVPLLPVAPSSLDELRALATHLFPEPSAASRPLRATGRPNA
jgi:hypothetical protein